MQPKTLFPKLAASTLIAIALVAGPTPATASPATVQVEFHDDDMGFNVTSSKDISNVIVEYCDGSHHKHDDLNGTTYVHREDQNITGVWIKSGNNQGEDGPPGSGERFDNEGVECDVTEVPVFPNAITLGLGIVGALGAAFLVMRRRS